MSEVTARARLEAWAVATLGIDNLSYKRDSEHGGGHLWTVRIDYKPEGAVNLVVVLASAMQLEQACGAAIEGLTEYGAEVP